MAKDHETEEEQRRFDQDLRGIRDEIRTTRRGRFAWWLVTVGFRAAGVEIDGLMDRELQPGGKVTR